MSPGCLPENAPLKADCLNTQLGQILAVANASAIRLLEFVDCRALPNALARLQLQAGCGLGIGRGAVSAQLRAELAQYFNKTQPWFEVPVIQHGTAFERTVWAAFCDIPMGQTSSFGAFAAGLGKLAAALAVARASGTNVLAIVVPCHWVMSVDGALASYSGGRWRKRRLLEIEAP